MKYIKSYEESHKRPVYVPHAPGWENLPEWKPKYKVGDYVGGCPIDLTSVKQYLDYPCIIETADKKKRLRRIGYNDKKFFLFGTNTRYKGGPLFELSPVLLKVSPVFWHRMHGVTNEDTTSITYSQTG